MAPPVGRNVSELIRQVKAFQHVRATGEVTPSGWQPGKPTLKPGPDWSGKSGKVWKPEMALLAFSLHPPSSYVYGGEGGKDLYSNLCGMRMEVQPFKDFLGSRGFKSTRERQIILKELEARKDHFNAEKLYSVLNRKGTKGLTTHDLSNVKASGTVPPHRKA